MGRYKQNTLRGKHLFVGIDLHRLQWHVGSFRASEGFPSPIPVLSVHVVAHTPEAPHHRVFSVLGVWFETSPIK